MKFVTKCLPNRPRNNSGCIRWKRNASLTGASMLVLTSAALTMPASAQSYTNYDGSKTNDLTAALATWTSNPEFQYKSVNPRQAPLQGDWGLAAMNAQYAYVLGLSGAGVKLGSVDSGLLLTHEEFANRGNVTAITISGTYLNDGSQNDGGGLTWKAGNSFSTPGSWNGVADLANHIGKNDNHGSHVSGTIAAAKNGLDANGAGMMGVAFGSQYYITNSNGTDSSIYGSNMDYNYFKEAYGQLAAAGVRAINSSWGSPDRADNVNTVAGMAAAYASLESMNAAGVSTKKSWLDAAADVSLQTGVIQVFAAGNVGSSNPNIRASAPYFRPEIEQYWVAAAALNQDLTLASFSNKCGVAKYWCISAPGVNINSLQTTSNSAYASENGTSMSAPHVTGALGILMERYPSLDNEAIRTILFTTAQHLGSGPADVPNDIFGWGIPDLQKGMNGPSQLLGVFNANMAAGMSDTWSNNISEAALSQRKAEEAAEIQAWVNGGKAQLESTLQSSTDPAAKAAINSQITLTQERIDQLTQKTDQDYVGTFVKTGAGTLTLTGTNTYSGLTSVTAGVLEIGGSIKGSADVSGGVLTGGGTIGGSVMVGNGAAFAPGNGTAGSMMNVGGNLALQSGAIYAVLINTSTSSFANVAGTAALAGTVWVLSPTGEYRFNSNDAILTSAGLNNTRFDGLAIPAGISGSLTYTSGAVLLDLTSKLGQLAGLNLNQRAVGAGLDAAFNARGSSAGLGAMFSGNIAQNLTQASGETATGSQQTTFNAMNQFMGVMTDPFVAGRGAGGSVPGGAPGYGDEQALGYAQARKPNDALAAIYTKAPQFVPFTPSWSVWAAGFGGSQTTDGNALAGSTNTTSSIYGTAVGADYLFSPDTLAGFALAGGGSNFSVNGQGSGRSDLFQAGAFVRHNVGAAYISAALAYGWQDVTTNRSHQHRRDRPAARRVQCQRLFGPGRGRLSLRHAVDGHHALRRRTVHHVRSAGVCRAGSVGRRHIWTGLWRQERHRSAQRTRPAQRPILCAAGRDPDPARPRRLGA